MNDKTVYKTDIKIQKNSNSLEVQFKTVYKSKQGVTLTKTQIVQRSLVKLHQRLDERVDLDIADSKDVQRSSYEIKERNASYQEVHCQKLD